MSPLDNLSPVPTSPRSFADIPEYDPVANTLKLRDGNVVSLEIEGGTANFNIHFDSEGKYYEVAIPTATIAAHMGLSVLGVLSLTTQYTLAELIATIEKEDDSPAEWWVEE